MSSGIVPFLVIFFFNCAYAIMTSCFGRSNLYDKTWRFNKTLKHFNRVTNKKKCRVSNEMKHHINTNKVKINEISVAAWINLLVINFLKICNRQSHYLRVHWLTFVLYSLSITKIFRKIRVAQSMQQWSIFIQFTYATF